MGTLLAILKAIFTRLVFAGHGFIAICSPIILLFFEGLFTLAIKETQEWKCYDLFLFLGILFRFCPSVFLYLLSVIPSIWLLELEKIDKNHKIKGDFLNVTLNTKENLKELNNLIGVEIELPEINLSTETWITVIEQFLMLILIIGRWMLPKGELTRDQLSQLLLVYIGTAADIIEFFDSFKDEKVAMHPILVLLTLSIWSWSLLQFTVVLTATKSRKSRLTTASSINTNNYCCGIDVCGIVINITLQDAPFLVFRLLLITHFNIISYMNIFFTCKNTLVIILQLYRLQVVYSESKKQRKKKRVTEDFELTSISIISKDENCKITKKKKINKSNKSSSARQNKRNQRDVSDSEEESFEKPRHKKLKNPRKDTGYSTGSSPTNKKHYESKKKRQRFDEEDEDVCYKKGKESKNTSGSEDEPKKVSNKSRKLGRNMKNKHVPRNESSSDD
ncbi:transmembrane protein 26 [Onthophagus taurus]|uniref:transmembrane protein 26 n=1 Tax=Onthophagus taurus TaxID=166361 RepID=UPI0039BE4E6C